MSEETYPLRNQAGRLVNPRRDAMSCVKRLGLDAELIVDPKSEDRNYGVPVHIGEPGDSLEMD